MKAIAAFAITTAFALAGAHAVAAPVKPNVLYNQNSNFGQGIVSDNFTSAPSYDSIGADDFWVPAGETWQISEADVTGAYVSGSGPASSVVVTFWGGAFAHRMAQPGGDTCRLFCPATAGCFSGGLPLSSRGKPVVRLRG